MAVLPLVLSDDRVSLLAACRLESCGLSVCCFRLEAITDSHPPSEV